MRQYKLVSKRGEGSFAEVIKAQNIGNGKFFAVKCMKSSFSNMNEVNNLREIKALRRLSPHPNIVSLEEVLFDAPTGRLALVFELMHNNLYESIKGRRTHLGTKIVKSYMHQLYRALDHMHSKGIFHRDIKPENILLDKSGKHLKVADLGSCRGIYNKQPYTEYISTRWYRAPECLLTDGYYGPEMDIWAAGCVLFEVISLYPLFPGSDELDQINRIHKILGSPPRQVLTKLMLRGTASSHMSFDFPQQKGIGIAHLIPHAPPDCIDLLTKSIRYELQERMTARGGIQHPYFSEFRDSESQSSGQPSSSNADQHASHSESAKHALSLASITDKTDPHQALPEQSQTHDDIIPRQRQHPLPSLEKDIGSSSSSNGGSSNLLPLLPGALVETKPQSITSSYNKEEHTSDSRSSYGVPRQTTDSQLSSSGSTNNKQIRRLPMHSKSSLPPLASQRKSSIPKLKTSNNRQHIGKPSNNSNERRKKNYANVKSSGYGNKNYANVKSSGYGKSNRIPQNKRYAHVTSSGYGKRSSSSSYASAGTGSSTSAFGKKATAKGGGGIRTGAALPSIGQRSMRARGVVRNGALVGGIRKRT